MKITEFIKRFSKYITGSDNLNDDVEINLCDVSEIYFAKPESLFFIFKVKYFTSIKPGSDGIYVIKYNSFIKELNCSFIYCDNPKLLLYYYLQFIVSQMQCDHNKTYSNNPGFGFIKDEYGIIQRIPHIGGIKIGKNVEIGRFTAIDQGVIKPTTIGDNVKIDNLCHIAHNVEIGDNSMIIAGCVICGSVKIGKNVFIGANSVIREGLTVGDYSMIGMGSVVTKDVPSGVLVYGNPAKISDKKPHNMLHDTVL